MGWMPRRVIAESSHGPGFVRRARKGWKVGRVAGMASIPDSFRALVAEQRDGDVDRGLRELSPGELPEGDVTVRVRFSSVNYKDALAVSPKGRVARVSPLVPGIDLAGEVVDGEGQGGEVIVHGYDLGVETHGGYADDASVAGGWA